MKQHTKKEITMKVIYFLAGLSLSVLLSACATIRGGEDVDQGRQAMLAGNYQQALGLFQDTEKVNPTYVYGTELRAGVSSYLGRTQYFTGASASDSGKGNFAAPQRQCRTAIPWPYVVSARRPKGGANEHPKWHERNLQLA